MQRTKAPFRADEVGSLLRPPRIKEARAKLEKGEITADDLRKVEDSEIEKVVHKQAQIGSRYLALLQLGARLLDLRRPQQAADLVGTEWGCCSLHFFTPEN